MFRPQIRKIYRVLMAVAMRSSSSIETEGSKYICDDNFLENDLRVVQHISPSCRVARKKQYADLFASKVC